MMVPIEGLELSFHMIYSTVYDMDRGYVQIDDKHSTCDFCRNVSIIWAPRTCYTPFAQCGWPGSKRALRILALLSLQTLFDVLIQVIIITCSVAHTQGSAIFLLNNMD